MGLVGCVYDCRFASQRRDSKAQTYVQHWLNGHLAEWVPSPPGKRRKSGVTSGAWFEAELPLLCLPSMLTSLTLTNIGLRSFLKCMQSGHVGLPDPAPRSAARRQAEDNLRWLRAKRLDCLQRRQVWA